MLIMKTIYLELWFSELLIFKGSTFTDISSNLASAISASFVANVNIENTIFSNFNSSTSTSVSNIFVSTLPNSMVNIDGITVENSWFNNVPFLTTLGTAESVRINNGYYSHAYIELDSSFYSVAGSKYFEARNHTLVQSASLNQNDVEAKLIDLQVLDISSEPPSSSSSKKQIWF